jgi:membrane protease YdiL (CAAX protease family)
VTKEEIHFLVFAALLTPPGAVIFGRMLARIRAYGGRVNAEKFGIPDLFMAFFMAAYFALGVLAESAISSPVQAASIMKTEDVVKSAAGSLVMLFIVIGFLAVRKLSPSELFGLQRIGIWKAGITGGLLVAAIFPPLMLASYVVQKLMGGQVKEQEVVEFFREAAGANQQSSIAAMFVMAVVVAPIFEEIVFRGYLYAVFKSWAGSFASLVFTAALFAAVHNNVAVLPSLLILAVGLTIAYEWSGSILVPIAMHATFNALQLVTLLVALKQSSAS